MKSAPGRDYQQGQAHSNALVRSQAEATEIVRAAIAHAKAALSQARAVLQAGQWRDPDGQLKAIVRHVRNSPEGKGGV